MTWGHNIAAEKKHLKHLKHLKRQFSRFLTHVHGPMDQRTNGRKKASFRVACPQLELNIHEIIWFKQGQIVVDGLAGAVTQKYYVWMARRPEGRMVRQTDPHSKV